MALLDQPEYAHLRCPITLALMVDPVITPCGHSFGRNAIGNWVQQNSQTCPVCRAPVTEERIRPNTDLERQVTTFGRLNPELIPAQQDIPTYNPWARFTPPAATPANNRQPRHIGWEERILRNLGRRAANWLGTSTNRLIDSLHDRAIEQIAPGFSPVRSMANFIGTNQNHSPRPRPQQIRARAANERTENPVRTGINLDSYIQVLSAAFGGFAIFGYLFTMFKQAVSYVFNNAYPQAPATETTTPQTAEPAVQNMPLFPTRTASVTQAPLHLQQRVYPHGHFSRELHASQQPRLRSAYTRSPEEMQRNSQLEQMARDLLLQVSRRSPIRYI